MRALLLFFLSAGLALGQAGLPRTTTSTNVAGTPLNPSAVIDALLVGLTANDSTKLVYSTQDHAKPKYVRSTTCWAASLDLTCASPWNSINAGLNAGTAITPRHVVFASHALITHGGTMRFITPNGTVVNRKLTNSYQVSSSDIRVGLLDSDLPATIKPAKLLPDDWSLWFTAPGHAIVCFDQEEKATVSNILSLTETNVNLTIPQTGQRAAFNEALIIGDSGNPWFIFVNGQTVLLGCALTNLSAPTLIASHRAGVLATIASLGAFGHAPKDVVMDPAVKASLTEKGRIAPRVTTITSSATPTFNTDKFDAVSITAQAEAITSMTTGLTGAPQNLSRLTIRIKDNGTARAITWGASYASSQATLPTTTVISKVTTVSLTYNAVKAKWMCSGVDTVP